MVKWIILMSCSSHIILNRSYHFLWNFHIFISAHTTFPSVSGWYLRCSKTSDEVTPQQMSLHEVSPRRRFILMLKYRLVHRKCNLDTPTSVRFYWLYMWNGSNYEIDWLWIYMIIMNIAMQKTMLKLCRYIYQLPRVSAYENNLCQSYVAGEG